MSQIRFNHVFLGLMGVGVVCAFAIPPRVTNRAQGKVEGLLWPVVKPVRGIARSLHEKYADKPLPAGETRLRGDSELSTENAQLRQQVAFLYKQLDELKYVEAERMRMGDLLDYCTPVRVMAGDASPSRDSITLAPFSGTPLPAGTAVLCADGIVGKTTDGTRVRLITDRDFVIAGGFGRFADGKWTPISTPRASVVGAGQNRMIITNLTVKEAGELQPADWVVLNDGDTFPGILQGRKLGQIESVKPQTKNTLYAEIIVRPKSDLRLLKEVMVLSKPARK